MLNRFSGNVAQALAYIKAKKATQPIVYHYTNGHGLKGIIESKTIWATHIGFMNDTREYREAVGLLSKLATARIETGTLQQTAAETVLKLAEATNRALTADNFFPWFVSCFSECKDDLAQWRGYSERDSRFALGMELNHIGALAYHLSQPGENRFRYRIHLVPAIYEQAEKEKILGMLIDFIIAQYPKDEIEARPEDKDQFRKDWLSHFASLASVIAATTKDDAFSQEREWRLIVMPMEFSDIKYRNRGSLLSPYIEIPLAAINYKSDDKEYAHPVRECWIGPSPHLDANNFAARNMLSVNNFYSVQMNPSKVPFRDL